MTGFTGKVRKSLFSIFFAVFIARAISFGAQIVLARLLSPKDFGLMAIAMMLIASFNLLQSMGVGEALVVQKERMQEAGDTAILIMAALGFGMAMIIYFSAPPIAGFFDTDREALSRIVRMLALILVFNSLCAVPNMLFEKDLAFEKKMLIEIAPAVGYAASSLGLAFLGYGVWSLVYGRVFAAFLAAPIAWKLSPFRPAFRFDLSMAKSLLTYGKFIALGSIASFGVANIDNVIVGKLLDFTALGYYSMAFTISNLVAVNVSQLVNRVAFPTYARVADNQRDVKKVFLLAIRYISMIAAPFSMILITLGHDLTRTILGEKWLPMVPALQIISVYAFLRALFSNAGPLFNGIGKPQYVFFINISQVALLFVFLIPMTRFFNIVGTSIGALVVTIITVGILLRWLKTAIGLTLTEIFRHAGPSIGIAVAVGALNVSLIKGLAPAAGLDVLSPLAIAMTLACSVAVFFAALYFSNRKIFRDMVAFIKGEYSF